MATTRKSVIATRAIMDRHAIAAVLTEIAAILEITGGNPFKIRAYENAARAIEGLANFEAMVARDALTEVKGIGKNIAEHIKELMTTGRIAEYEALRAAVPIGLLEILHIPGVGPKKAKLFLEKLGIKDIGGLEQACRAHRVAGLPRIGEKIEAKIMQGIQYVRAQQGRHLFHVAWHAAEPIVAQLAAHPAAIRAALAGSLRRRKEVVKDIDIVASARGGSASGGSSRHPEQLMEFFLHLPMVQRIEAQGATKSTVVLTSGIYCDLRVVTDAEFPSAMHHFTGSKEHNIAMRARAQAMGYKINEYGLFKITKSGEKLIPCADEAAIYAALDLAYVPPELREDMGEVEAAAMHRLPKLVEADDLRGIFHCHTTYSDGRATLEQMVAGAKERGYEYIGISDHSQSAGYAGGLKPAAITQQHKEIDALQKKFPDVRIFKGIESDILADGALDYSDEILQTFDFVIASIHSRFNLTTEEMTRRICTAIAHPAVTILAHPTGRLLLSRESYPVDMQAVIDAAAKHDVVIEINANPQRLELDWRHGPYARSKGVKTMVNPDAHSVAGIDEMRTGVGIARKGWWQKDEVVNTWSREKVERWLQT